MKTSACTYGDLHCGYAGGYKPQDLFSILAATLFSVYTNVVAVYI